MFILLVINIALSLYLVAKTKRIETTLTSVNETVSTLKKLLSALFSLRRKNSLG